MKTKRELKGDLTEGTVKIGLVILVSVLLLGFVSASAKEQIREEVPPFKVSDEVCSSFLYKNFYKSYLNGFSVEVLTTNEDVEEHFYVILKEDNCKWDYTFYDSYERRPDITVSGDLNNKEQLVLKSNTLRGLIIKNKVEREIL